MKIRICAYCFANSEALAVLGCETGCIYDYAFCSAHIVTFCAEFNNHALQPLPCWHTPEDMIYCYNDDLQVLNSDGMKI